MKHPYIEFENTVVWEQLRNELESLIENNDIVLTTAEQYVIGSICKRLKESDLLNEKHALQELTDEL